MNGLSRRYSKLLLALSGLLAMAVMLTLSSPADARGSVQIKNRSPEEADGTWKLKFSINYGSTPNRNYIPMIFSFKQTAIYERSFTDDSPKTAVMRTVPVRNATPNNLPMDVGFADVSGKAFKITKFSIKLRRDADFEAGEYRLTVKLASGGTIGRPQTIKLRGKNKAIDRRSIVFTAEAPKKKKSNEAPKQDVAQNDGKPKAAEDFGPDLSDIPDDPDAVDEPDAPPAESPKQGGCGCVVVGNRSAPGAGLLSILALMAGLALRRRD